MYLLLLFDVGTAPTAPSGVTLSQDADADSWDISWTDNSSDETGFDIQYELNNSGTWALLTSVAANTTSSNNNSIPGVQHGDDVSVRVRAAGATTSSAYVEVASPTTASFNAPTAPSSFTISENGFGSVTGSFTDNSSNEDNFIVEANPNGAGFESRETLAANTTSISSHAPAIYYSVTNGQNYQMRVKAIRFGRESAATNSNTLSLANQPS